MDYDRHHDRLIARAQARPHPAGYTERHHIVPRCLGGDDSQENKVVLTAPEHYIAHLLLVRMHPGNHKLVWAVINMASGASANNPGRSGNKLHGWLRRELSEARRGKKFTPEHRAKISAGRTGLKHSEETRAKMSASSKGSLSSRKGVIVSAETRAKLSAASKGKVCLPETRSKISASLKKTYHSMRI